MLLAKALLKVPWTARRSNQSVLKEISPECSLEGLMLKLKLQYSGLENSMDYGWSVGHDWVQSLSHVQLFETPWTTARQASLFITNSWSPPKPMSIESVMPSDHLILCHPFLLLPSIFPSIRVFLNESALPIRWPKSWSFSFSTSPSSE